MRRVLLDESLPRRLAAVLSGIEVVSVTEADWAGERVGEGELIVVEPE